MHTYKKLVDFVCQRLLRFITHILGCSILSRLPLIYVLTYASFYLLGILDRNVILPNLSNIDRADLLLR